MYQLMWSSINFCLQFLYFFIVFSSIFKKVIAHKNKNETSINETYEQSSFQQKYFHILIFYNKKVENFDIFSEILFRGKTEFFQIYFTQKYVNLSCEYNRYFSRF